MLKMKGMIAKLFSAVLALGMVIQPVTPLESPIIVFAQDEEVNPNPETSPAPSGSPDAGEGNMPDPGAGEGNMPDPGAGEGNMPDPGAGEGNTPDSGDTPEPTPGESEETNDYVLDVTVVNNTIKVTKSGDKADSINSVKIVGKKTITTSASSDTSEFTVDCEFAENADALTYTFNKVDVNAAVIYSVSRIEAYSDSATDALDNVKVDGVEDGLSFSFEKETFDDSARTNDKLSVTVSNPAVNTNYMLQLSNVDGSQIYSVSEESIDGSNIVLTIDTSKLNGFYNAIIIIDDNNDPVWNVVNIEYDHISPNLISLTPGADNVQITLNENVPTSTLAIVFNATYNNQENTETITPELISDLGNNYTYKYTFKDLSGEDGDHCGTTYEINASQFTSLKDEFENVFNTTNVNVDNFPPSIFVDEFGPKLISHNVTSENEEVAEYAKSPVTLTVTFNEQVTNPQVTLVNNSDNTSTSYEMEGHEIDNLKYSYTFDDIQDGNYTIASVSASDLSEKSAVLPIDKTFTLDTVNPEISDISFTDVNGNTVASDSFVNSDVIVSLSFNEEVVNPTISFAIDEEEKTVGLKKDTESSSYSYIFETNVNEYHSYSGISFNATDNAGNTLDSSSINDQIPSEFMIDKIAPSIEIDQYVVDSDGEALNAEDSEIVLTGKEYIGLYISVNDTESELDLQNSPIQFYTTDADGQQASINAKRISDARGDVYYIYPQQNLSNISVEVKDVAGNTAEDTWERPVIIEKVNPIIKTFEVPEDLTNGEYQSYTISLDVTDQEDTTVISSGLKSITYLLTKDGQPVAFDNGLNPAEMSSSYTFYSFDNQAPTINDLVYSRGGQITVSSFEGNELNGLYELTVTVEDNSGNTVSESKNLKFDVGSPVVEINKKEELAVTNTKHTVEFTAHDEPVESNDEIANIYLWLTDANGSRVEFTNADDTTGFVRTLDADATSYTIDCKDLNGVFTVHMSAIDEYGNGTNPLNDETAYGTATAEVKFDNTKPDVVISADNSDSRKSHTVNFTITEKPDSAFSGIDNVKYWLTDADGTVIKFEEGKELEDGKYTYYSATDEEVSGLIDTSVEEDEYAPIEIKDSVGLNGKYTLHVSAADKLNPDDYTEDSVNLIFDNTAPELSDLTIDNEEFAEQKHTISFNISDGPENEFSDDPENYSSKIASVEYWLTKQGSDKKVAFATTLGQLNDENVAVVNAGSLGEVANPENDKLDNKSFEATIQSLDGAEMLNGEYDLHIVLKDTAGNSNEYVPVADKVIKFDTQPLDVSVTYVPVEGATYLAEDSTIFTNDYPTIKVSVTDNYLDELDAGDLKLLWLTDGTEHVLEDSEFTLNADKSAYELEFIVGESVSDEDLETIRNTFVYSGSDHAGNGANVTIHYGTTEIREQSAFVPDEADANVTTITPLVVDKIAPKYTIDIDNPVADNEPVEGSVYNNRVYYGEDTVSQLTPSVSIVEGNFSGDDYQLSTVYSDGGNNYENADVDAATANWSDVATETASFPKQDGDIFTDGVYRFAVRGTDKAGNLLVPSEDEKTHVNELATGLVPETANAYWTNVKIVDTKIDLYFGISDPDAADKYFEYSTKDNRSADNLYRQTQTADIVVSANVDDIVEKSPTKISMRVDSTNADASGTFGTDFGYGDYEHRLPEADQKFLIKDVTVTDRAGNSVTYSMVVGDTIYLDVTNPDHTIDITAPSISVRAETPITIRNTEDNRPLFNSAVNLLVSVNDPNPEYCSGVKTVTYSLYADGNLIFTQTRNAGDSHYSDRATFSEVVVADPNVYAALETNNIELVVTAEDNSGNSIEDRETFGIDTVAPVVEISFDNNSAQHDKYFKENRVATVKVTDRNINTSLIEVHTSVGHSAFSAIQNGGGNGANDYRTFTIPYTEDGDYTLNITGTDALGNRFDRPIFVDGTVAGSEFTIDKTTPVIHVSFNNNDVRNGKYYKAGRVATVTIDEHNFLADEVTIDQTASIQRGSTGAPSPSGFGTSGDTHTATINYAADGNYTLRVNYTDMAGNVAQEVVVDEFTIDTTKPVVRFDENTVTDNMATNGVIAPSVIFDDTNFDANGINVTLTGARVDNHNHPFTRTVTQFGSVITFSDFARVKESDDIYTAKATITDLAGNTAEATVRFSVNRFGSTFDFNDDEPTIDLVDSYYAQETGNVIIREVNVNKLTGYTLTVNRDGSNITLVEGEDFRVISSSIAGGYQYIYEIFPDVFSSEGTYSIIVQSVDEAGNTNTNSTVRTDDGVNDYPVVFAIDKTLPTVSIDELDPDDRSNNNFNENTKTFRISVRDNNAMSRVIVTVDGNVVFDMEGQELAEYLEEHGGFVEITLDASSGYQTIKVQAFDGAGNESADTQYQVLVTTNFFVRFFYNKPLFYGSIVFLILLLLAIAYYIKKRMDKQKENA